MSIYPKLILLVMIRIRATYSAPLHFPLLQPLPGTWQQQQLALQEQMLALQQFQALQQFNQLPSPMAMNFQQPLLVLIPNPSTNMDKNERHTEPNDRLLTKNKPMNEIKDYEDSITIDAESEEIVENNVNNKETPMRAILLVPNRARFSIGEFISGIPWLPIEINVPDSISWIYEGISGIISGIGQRWPFNRPQMSGSQTENMKMWKDLNKKKIMPIIVMPLGQPMMPNF